MEKKGLSAWLDTHVAARLVVQALLLAGATVAGQALGLSDACRAELRDRLSASSSSTSEPLEWPPLLVHSASPPTCPYEPVFSSGFTR